MDRALSISWYDLPESSRARYLDWLHGSYPGSPVVAQRIWPPLTDR